MKLDIRTAVLVSCLTVSSFAATAQAEEPCSPPPTPAPPPALTGSLGAGLAHTSGNTDTTNANVSFTLQYDPKTDNVVKAGGLYLRGRSADTDTVNQATVGVRDEYKLSERIFVFADVHYLHDEFKEVSYLITPLAGVGYQVVKTDRTAFALDVAAGGAFEKDEGMDSTTSGAYHVGESFSHKISDTARIAQNATAIWKTTDSADALYHFDVALATAVTHWSELSVSFVDDIKNKPATPTTEKSDTAVVMAFVMKF